ncbi:LacI family DNA-binding transcriptional regulator [Microvirga sp. G4-2]|uniref:LacI family DNA-binding transcriptional regulator n=1 Tax=Microvirga sp. G4-2 TaxID=3434467 RepID=UPI004043B771
MRNPRKPQVTIIDVARELKLAPSTVSNALRGKPVVAEETRKRILAQCRAMNYVASPVARALREGRTFTVGVLLPDIANPIFGDIVKGLDSVMAASGFATLLASTEGSRERFLSAARTFAKRDVDALVMISQPVGGEEFERLVELCPPIVLTHRKAAGLDLDYIGMDNHGGSMAALQHLAALGHRRIGFIGGPEQSSAAQERLDGYRQAVQELSLDPDPALVCPGDYTLMSGFKAAHHLLSIKKRPTAILAANDLMACAVLDVAVQMELTIPGDLSVIGFDDIFVSSFPQIALSTIRQPASEIGNAIGRRLIERFDSGNCPACHVVLPTQLVVRASIGPPARRKSTLGRFSEQDLNAYLQNRWKPTSQVHP